MKTAANVVKNLAYNNKARTLPHHCTAPHRSTNSSLHTMYIERFSTFILELSVMVLLSGTGSGLGTN